MFRRMAAAFDAGGAKGLLLSHLQLAEEPRTKNTTGRKDEQKPTTGRGRLLKKKKHDIYIYIYIHMQFA